MSADDRKPSTRHIEFFSPEKVTLALEAHLALPNDETRERKLLTELNRPVGSGKDNATVADYAAADAATCVLRNVEYLSAPALTSATIVMAQARKIGELDGDKTKMAELINEVAIFLSHDHPLGQEADRWHTELQAKLGEDSRHNRATRTFFTSRKKQVLDPR